MSAKTGALTVKFYLSGCQSLKDKRRRLGKLRDKFGRQTGLAVSETDSNDNHRQSEWTFVAVAASAQIVEQMFAEVENYVSLSVDAEVTDMSRRWLA